MLSPPSRLPPDSADYEGDQGDEEEDAEDDSHRDGAQCERRGLDVDSVRLSAVVLAHSRHPGRSGRGRWRRSNCGSFLGSP